MLNLNELSIVIPVGPDDQAWHHLLKELEIFGREVEIILSACQSPVEEIELPDNVQWIQTQQGRGKQLNAGVQKATGCLIWFLHADSRFTQGIVDAIQQMNVFDNHTLGYFRLKFAADGPRQTQINAWAANIRSGFFGLPFGDQGFVMRKTVFEQLNGFDETILQGEDLDFIVRAHAAGITLHELQAELLTSSRRYQQYGWLATTTRHLWLTWLLTRQAKRRLVYS